MLALHSLVLALPLTQPLYEVLKDLFAIALFDSAEAWLPLEALGDLVISAQVAKLGALLL